MSAKASSIVYRENLNFFEGPNEDNDAWFKKLDQDKKNKMNQYVQRANFAYANAKRDGMPWFYKSTLDWYREHEDRLNAGTGPVNYEAIYAIDTSVNQTIWDNDTFAKVGIPEKMANPTRWQIKDFRINSENWPGFSKSFQNPAWIWMAPTEAWTPGIGMCIGYSLSWTEMRMSQGALWDVQAFLMQDAAAKLGIYKSRRGFRGTSIVGAQNQDGGAAAGFTDITGIFNNANAQTVALGASANNVVTTQGDVEYSLYAMLNLMKKNYWDGDIVIVSTSGIASQIFRMRDTYQQLQDITRIRSLFESGIINRWIVSDQLYSSVPIASTQQMMMIKVNPNLVNNVVIFPQQTLPFADKKFDADLKEVLLYANAIQFKSVDTTNNAYGLVTNSATVTASSTGFIKEGTDITPMLTGSWKEDRGVDD